MNAIIKQMTLNNFKGFKDKTIVLKDGMNTIAGANGTGKTTIGTAYHWVFSNCDYDMNSNPMVFPMNAEEATVSVTIDMEIDGKPVRVTKSQTRKLSKPDANGVVKSAYTNFYAVNEVPLAERDYKQKLNEYGFDFDKNFALSHPEVFFGIKKDEQRKILFGMASSLTDKQIAEQTEDAEQVCELLDTYNMDEIKAMQKATLDRIKAEYGKDGEILRAKIEGLEMAKVSIDTAELNNQKMAIEKQIKDVEKQIANAKAEYEKLPEVDILQLEFAKNEIIRKHNEEWSKDKIKLMDDLRAAEADLNNIKVKTVQAKAEMDSKVIRKGNIAERITSIMDSISKTEKEVFEGGVCPTCGREYPIDEYAKMKANFDKVKANNIKMMKSDLTDYEKELTSLDAEIKDLTKSMTGYKKDYEGIEAKVNEIKAKIDACTDAPDISNREDITAINKQIADANTIANKRKEYMDKFDALKDSRITLENECIKIEKELLKVAVNAEIEKGIEALHDMQRTCEQNKADAENIMYQLELVAKRRNELLTEEINSHFNCVKFELFEYLKNGNYRECVNVRIDDRKFGESTNTGRELIAKLDIINGLQNFYGQFYPVFIDGFECLSAESIMRVDASNTQIVALKVTESKELEVI